MGEQYKSALIRALIIAVLSGVATALTTWATTDELKPIIIAGGTAFLTPLIARFGGEGTYDTRRQRLGDVRPGDVGAIH
jgi:hypothetical protein